MNIRKGEAVIAPARDSEMQMEDVQIRKTALAMAFDLIPETAAEAVANARTIEAYLRGETESLVYRS